MFLESLSKKAYQNLNIPTEIKKALASSKTLSNSDNITDDDSSDEEDFVKEDSIDLLNKLLVSEDIANEENGPVTIKFSEKEILIGNIGQDVKDYFNLETYEMSLDYSKTKLDFTLYNKYFSIMFEINTKDNDKVTVGVSKINYDNDSDINIHSVRDLIRHFFKFYPHNIRYDFKLTCEPTYYKDISQGFFKKGKPVTMTAVLSKYIWDYIDEIDGKIAVDYKYRDYPTRLEISELHKLVKLGDGMVIECNNIDYKFITNEFDVRAVIRNHLKTLVISRLAIKERVNKYNTYLKKNIGKILK